MRFALTLAAISLFVIAGCSGGTGGTGQVQVRAQARHEMTTPAAGDTGSTDTMTDTTGTGG